jgi:hypothetical protein
MVVAARRFVKNCTPVDRLYCLGDLFPDQLLPSLVPCFGIDAAPWCLWSGIRPISPRAKKASPSDFVGVCIEVVDKLLDFNLLSPCSFVVILGSLCGSLDSISGRLRCVIASTQYYRHSA